MENTLNKGVKSLKKNLYYILFGVIGIFLLVFLIKASFYIGVVALVCFGAYKLWKLSKECYSKVKIKREKQQFEKEMSKMKENLGNITYMKADIVKENELSQAQNEPFTYIDVDYEEVKTK